MKKPFKLPKRPKPPSEPPRKFKTGDWVDCGNGYLRIAQITGYGLPFGPGGPLYYIRFIDEFGNVTDTGLSEQYLRPADAPNPLPTPALPTNDW